MDTMYPELCQRMQIKIIDILLQDFYFTQDCYLERSRILLKKGRSLRTSGHEGLTDCIRCLSEAISIIVSYSTTVATACFFLCHILLVIEHSLLNSLLYMELGM